ncbi:MAG: AAA family ATPase [Chloroflexi bacterium]|nr:AAA family ATPase [Chloroflexota bacterium]
MSEVKFVLEVRLLGQFDVRRDGATIAIPSRAAQAFLAYLLLSIGTTHRREKLAGLFWPDTTEETARKNLRNELWRLRKTIETETPSKNSASYFLIDEISIGFNAASDYWLDVSVVQAPLAKQVSVDEFVETLSHYRGELLPGLYDDWVMLERERVRAVFEQKIARLLELLVEEKRWQETLDWGERWISFGQTPEPAYRALMLAHNAKGDKAKVALTYQRCATALQSDLGVNPSKETQSLFEQLTKDEITSPLTIPAESKSPVSTEPSKLTNLPVPLTSFIGREKEIAAIMRLLNKHRLVTLTGPGGVGKTRLAIQTAKDSVEKFKDGVWWIDFAPLSDENLIAQVVAQALDVRESPNQPLIESLKNYLREKQLLLVLDNCEHLISASAQLTHDLLTHCVNLRILATSREQLGVMGEILYQVPTLSVPEPQPPTLTDLLMEYESVRLFVERASAVKSDFALTEQNAAAVLKVCRQLDGIPLALELAAARTKLLTVEHIAERLNDRFHLLTQGSRTALPRQQTLRAAIDWSYDLLSTEARILFQRLSIFAGGFTLAATEGICSDTPLTPRAVLDLLTRLVDRSLVKVERQGNITRYRMLETTREYAIEKLQATVEFERIRDRHLSFFLGFVKRLEPQLRRGDEIGMREMEAEHDNVRAALDWSLKFDKQRDAAIGLAGETFWFWELRGMWSEARRWLETSLPPAELATPSRAKLLLLLAATIFNQSGPGKARGLMEESLAMWRELQDKWWVSFALYQLGWVDLYDRNLNAAESRFEECIQLARELDDDFLLGRGLHSLGGVLRRTHNPSAVAVLEEGLLVAQRSDDKGMIVDQLYHLGLAESSRGNIVNASKRYEEGLVLARELGNRSAIAEIQSRLAVDVVLVQGDIARADALIREGLKLSITLGMHVEIVFDLMWLGLVAAAREDYPRSAQLLSASEALFEKLGLSVSAWPDRANAFNQCVSRARSELDQTTFTMIWSKGRVMTLEQGIAYAFQSSISQT